eukprot:403360479
MEILIWLWIWDNRFFFGMKHHPHVVLNIWILPLMFGIVMGLHSYEQVFALKAVSEQKQGDINQCVDNDLGTHALHYQYMQVFNVVLLTLIMAKGYFEKSKHMVVKSSHNQAISTKAPSQIHHAALHFNYWQRQNTVFSYLGQGLLILNLYVFYLSFLISSAFAYSICSIEQNYENLPGAFITMIHSYAVQVFGIIAIGTFIFAVMIKTINVISFVTCPLKMLWFKKNIRNF